MVPGVRASRAKEEKRVSEAKKPELGKNVIELDFFYAYTGEERRMEDQKAPDKVQERQDQFGTCLIMASSETKAIHVVPAQSKGTASLKRGHQIHSGKCISGRVHFAGRLREGNETDLEGSAASEESHEPRDRDPVDRTRTTPVKWFGRESSTNCETPSRLSSSFCSMMKVIDSIGERVGREEYKDIE